MKIVYRVNNQHTLIVNAETLLQCEMVLMRFVKEYYNVYSVPTETWIME